MITAWMLYAMVVGSLLAAGGVALEKFFQSRQRPTRWVWVGAMLLALVWPPGHWTWENRPLSPPPVGDSPVLQPPASPPGGSGILPTGQIAVPIPPESLLRRMDGPVLVGWAGATGLLLLFFALLYLRTRRMARGWERGSLEGHEILISDEWGPAVVGILRPQVVLPGWCLEMEGRALQFILDHELEHLRAGDLRLMTLMGGLAVLFPWNLPLWWQLSRLRIAVEADCDRRVLLNNTGQTRSYLYLLLEVGRRGSPSPAFAAMLSEPYATLKRRIKIMTQPLPRRPWVKGAILLSAGGLLVAVACLAPGPMDARHREFEDRSAAPSLEETGISGKKQIRPRFTPFIVNPSVRNPEVVVAALEDEYAAALGREGIAGTVHVWFFLDEQVRIVRTIVNRSSGHRELDNLALRIADIIELSPALNRDQPVPVWVSLPVEFTVGGATETDVEAGDPGVNAVAERWTRASSETPVQVGGPTGEIRGRVTDASTDQPLRSVQIYLPDTEQGALTDGEGRFLLEAVPEGTRMVFAIMPGFGEVALEVGVTSEGPSEMTIRLEPTAIPLGKLVVRGGS